MAQGTLSHADDDDAGRCRDESRPHGVQAAGEEMHIAPPVPLPGTVCESSPLAAAPYNATQRIASLRPTLRTPLTSRNGGNETKEHSGELAAASTSSPSNRDDEDARAVRPALSLSWKLPERSKKPRAYTRPLSDDEDDQDDRQQGATQLPSQPVLSGRDWRTPMKRTLPSREEEQGRTVTESEQIDISVIDDDVPSSPQPEQEKALPSAPAPAWIQHRTSFGLDSLDERLGYQDVCIQGSPLGHVDDGAKDEQLGLAKGGLVEISGTPGSGKTTMVMQLAVRERIACLLQEHRRVLEIMDEQSVGSSSSNSSDGIQDMDESMLWIRCKEVAAHAVFIDTEGSMSAQRLAGIVVEEVNAARRDGALPVSLQDFVEGVLEGLHICRCITLHELLATLELLSPLRASNLDSDEASKESHPAPTAIGAPTQASQNPRAKQAANALEALRLNKMLPSHISLLVIDSVSYYFRAPVVGSETPARRERALHLAYLRSFISRARRAQPGLRIVATNQMALTFINPATGERLRLTDERGRGRLQPSLALRAWVPEDVASQHAWQVLLFREGNVRGRLFAQINVRPESLMMQASRASGHDLASANARPLPRDERYWRTWLPFEIDRDTGLLRGPSEG